MVVTDATCFMKWIAEQYGLQLPPHYEKYLKKNPRCSQGTGNINDVNREHCRYRRVHGGQTTEVYSNSISGRVGAPCAISSTEGTLSSRISSKKVV